MDGDGNRAEQKKKLLKNEYGDYAFREKKSKCLSFCCTDLLNYWRTEWIASVIQLREVFGFSYFVGVQRKEDACFLFSQVQPFKNDIAHLLRPVCADTERKGDYRFIILNLHTTPVGYSDGALYLILVQNSTFTECLYPCLYGRGGYIEQLANFHSLMAVACISVGRTTMPYSSMLMMYLSAFIAVWFSVIRWHCKCFSPYLPICLIVVPSPD